MIASQISSCQLSMYFCHWYTATVPFAKEFVLFQTVQRLQKSVGQGVDKGQPTTSNKVVASELWNSVVCNNSILFIGTVCKSENLVVYVRLFLCKAGCLEPSRADSLKNTRLPILHNISNRSEHSNNQILSMLVKNTTTSAAGLRLCSQP
jgi:hypothetical protein